MEGVGTTGVWGRKQRQPAGPLRAVCSRCAISLLGHAMDPRSFWLGVDSGASKLRARHKGSLLTVGGGEAWGRPALLWHHI